MRIIQTLVGFVIGAGFVAGLELFAIYLIAMLSGGKLEPTGIGWFIAPVVMGFAFGRACGESRQSRLFEAWFLGAFVWLLAAGLYYRYGSFDGSAKTALAVAAVAYVPVLLTFAGLLIYRKVATR